MQYYRPGRPIRSGCGPAPLAYDRGAVVQLPAVAAAPAWPAEGGHHRRHGGLGGVQAVRLRDRRRSHPAVLGLSRGPSFAVQWRRLSLRHGLLATVALLAAVAAVVSYATGALSALERDTVDTRFSMRGHQSPGHGIVIVALDTRTLNALNRRPPIPRSYYARLLDRLRADGARAIDMDVQFIGQTDPRDDNALLAAVARDGPVVPSTH